ncbi:MAG: TRAP transporter substrate-binding protein [Coriobacteriia bacterium]|nr:TRAP transporter substrate-binding protein [Coriobacteriia bacterium]
MTDNANMRPAERAKGNLQPKHIVSMVAAALIIVGLAALLSYAGATANSDADLGDVPAEYADLPTTVLIGADSAGKGSAGQLFGEYVAQRLQEITGGKLTLDYHANGDLGGDADLLRQVQYDDIQVMVCQTAPVVSFVPQMAVFDLPMAFATHDGDAIDSVLNGPGAFQDGISAAYESAGLHLLGFLQNATFRLTTSNKPVDTLADFKGLQIRTMENSNHMAFWQAIGAEPTPLAWSEVYISLQNGTVDAEENAADTIAGASFQEVQKYLACTNHILYCNQVCISKTTWDALDPAYQSALEQAVADAIQHMRPTLTELDQSNKQKLQAGGMTLVEYDETFFNEVLALDSVQALYDDIDTQTNGLASTLTEQLGEMG